MSESALDQALIDNDKYEREVDDIKADKEDWEKDQAKKKADMIEAGNGDKYEYEPWPEREPSPKPDFLKHDE